MLLARLIRKFNLVPVLKAFNRLTRRMAAYGHRVQFEAQWRIDPSPEWYDHFIHQYWLWFEHRNSMSWERGVFGTLALNPECRLLDLCCGGGFFTYHFYSGRAQSVIAVDFDPEAIAHAKTNFVAPNLEFRLADIRTQMPEGTFENITWDAAIEHFTEAETRDILAQIKRRLTPEGVLNGYTIIEKATGKSLSHHEYEFKSKEELAGILKRSFKNVIVFQTDTADALEHRQNLYFYASDATIPLAGDWPNMVRL